MHGAALIVVFAAGLAGQQVINRVLARVDSSVIMLSDLRAAVALGIVDAPGQDERAGLSQLIDRRVLLNEVARFPPPEPAAEAIDELAAAMTARAGGQLATILQTTGIDQAGIRALARDTLRIQAYVRQRFGNAATLADADVIRWLRDARTRTSVVEVK